MIKRPAARIAFFLVFLLSVTLFFSCEKDPDIVGLEITPGQDQLFVNAIDTFSITAYSVLEDSLVTGATSLNLAGGAFDPVFGKITSGFATQVLLSTVNPNFGNNPGLDSLVLVMSYNGYYGDTNTLQTFSVYELTDDLSSDKTYYSTTKVAHSGIDYSHHTFFPRPTDSVMVDTIAAAAQLRINLSRIRPDLGNKILYTPADYLVNNTKFIEYLKGIYVDAAPVSHGGAILYFNILSSNSKLVVYYHNDENDSLSYRLTINTNCVRFNHFDHYKYDFADQSFRKQLVYGDTTLGNQLLYIQSMSGVKVKLKFPHLKKWAADNKIAINDAQLILPGFENDPAFTPVAKLLAVKINADSTYSNLPDYSGGETYFGGSYNSDKKEYRFRITQYVQDILKESYVDNGIFLLSSGSSVRANRVLLTGPKHSLRPLQLRVVYSYLQ